MSQSAVRFHTAARNGTYRALEQARHHPGLHTGIPRSMGLDSREEQTNEQRRLAIQSVNHFDGQGDFDSKPLLSAYLSSTEMIFQGFP
jgi:hypothetical protein